MNIYEGRLKKLGVAQMQSDQRKYSLIEVGDDIVQNIWVSHKLNAFLDDGLNTSQPTKLWVLKMGLAGKGLAGVQVAGGKTYFSAPFSYGAVIFFLLMLLVPGIACIFNGLFAKDMGMGFFYLGVVLVAMAYFPVKMVLTYRGIPKDGAKVL